MKSAFLKKLLCVLSAAVLVLSFAACGNNEDEGTTTDPSVVEEGALDTVAGSDVSVSDTQADSSESDSAKDTQAQNSEKTEGTKNQSQSGGSTSSAPNSQADIIAAYNSAVTKSGLSRTAMTQTLTKGTVSVVNYDVMAGDKAGVRNQINVNNTSKTASDLKALSSSNVKKATRSGNTVTITLNTFSGSSASNGAG